MSRYPTWTRRACPPCTNRHRRSCPQPGRRCSRERTGCCSRRPWRSDRPCCTRSHRRRGHRCSAGPGRICRCRHKHRGAESSRCRRCGRRTRSRPGRSPSACRRRSCTWLPRRRWCRRSTACCRADCRLRSRWFPTCPAGNGRTSYRGCDRCTRRSSDDWCRSDSTLSRRSSAPRGRIRCRPGAPARGCTSRCCSRSRRRSDNPAAWRCTCHSRRRRPPCRRPRHCSRREFPPRSSDGGTPCQSRYRRRWCRGWNPMCTTPRSP